MSRESLFVSVLLVLALGLVWVARSTGPDDESRSRAITSQAESPATSTPGTNATVASAVEPSPDESPRLESTVTGTAVEADAVTTGERLNGAAGDVYLVAVATKPVGSVVAVDGLGLQWRRVGSQCSGRGTTAVDVWLATSPNAVSGLVTAAAERPQTSLSIVASRYSGASVDSPIGAVAGVNSNASPQDCEGGVESAAYEVVLPSQSSSSRTVVFAATREGELVANPSLRPLVAVQAGAGGDAAGLAVADDDVPTSADDTEIGERAFLVDLDNTVDAAVLAVELLPDDFRPAVPTLRTSSMRIEFGSQPVVSAGAAGVRRTVELTNVGQEPLVVSDVAVSGIDQDQFAVIGPRSFEVASDESVSLLVEFQPTRAENASARLEITSNDASFQDDVSLTGRGGALPEGLWISAAELGIEPMSGPAWERLKEAADGELGVPAVADPASNHDVQTLAVALVYARTGDPAYQARARDAIVSAIGTEAGTTNALQPCRNVPAYAIAADLIGLEAFDAEAGAALRTWLDEIRFVEWPDGSFIDVDEARANSHGRMCGMARVVIAAYLGDDADLARAAESFARFLGDRSVGKEMVWNDDLSWQADPSQPVGINPVGAEKDGLSIDGALPEEMRRGGPFATPPVPTGHPWEALQGIVGEAVVLDRAGYDVFDWSDRAILRSVDFLARLDEAYPFGGWWATGDDRWVPWVVNDVYGTPYPEEIGGAGKSIGWTAWTHGGAPAVR